ncbi:MAG: GT4 family glycosyltransferase PelF [Planctomycetota bacterium]
MLDVCLIVEGTYPYVQGGVSSWVSSLIEGLSTTRFGVVHVGPSGDVAREAKYPLHDNVARFVEVFIHDYALPEERTQACPGGWREALGVGAWRRREAYALLEELYLGLPERLAAGDLSGLAEVTEVLAGRGELGLSARDLVHSRESFELLQRLYDRYAPRESFIDFFWTARYVHLPLLRLLRAQVPRAAVYHATSTGFGGFLAATAARRAGAPLLLTEHGIYTKERKIEIQGADWIHDPLHRRRARPERSLGFFKEWWIQLFATLSRVAYLQASEVITLHEGNRRLQLEDGAPAERTRVVPNGIDLARYSGLRSRGPSPAVKETLTVALVGRVVPIKDIRTFLRASRRVVASALARRVEVLVVGPTDEDEAYYRECLLQAQVLGIERWVRFTGHRDLVELYPQLDCLVLTSISEGQPLVLLEAMAAGVPSVVTDVGACRELIEGRSPEDQALGASGVVCRVADHEAVADGIVRCLFDLDARARMVAAGQERVRRYYRLEEIQSRYLELYEGYRARFLAGERFYAQPAPSGEQV